MHFYHYFDKQRYKSYLKVHFFCVVSLFVLNHLQSVAIPPVWPQDPLAKEICSYWDSYMTVCWPTKAKSVWSSKILHSVTLRQFTLRRNVTRNKSSSALYSVQFISFNVKNNTHVYTNIFTFRAIISDLFMQHLYFDLGCILMNEVWWYDDSQSE